MSHYKALILSFALIALSHAFEHEGCTHGHTERTPEVLEIEEDFSLIKEINGDNRMLASYPQIRIQADYSQLNSAPSSYKNYIQNELAPAVIAYFEAALRVKYPVSGNLNVPSVQTDLCGIRTPNILLGQGVAADYYIFFDSQNAQGQGWIADSYVCFMASGSNRPLISTTKFNRAQLLEANGDVLLHEKNTYLLIHEMTHTFGFTASMFPYFIDEYGNQRRGHIKSGMINGQQATVIDVPPLTNNLRSFFGCSSLAGAYLESSGSSGTAGSHFNRRQFLFEYMTSGLLYQQRVSEFALAMLEGSGWYAPNYDYAEPYFFGQGEGCGFLFDSCTSSSFNYDEFCETTSVGCTFQGRGGGRCTSDTRSAGCRYYTANANLDCQNPNAAQFAVAPELQTFGRSANSKCFNGNLAPQGNNANPSSYCFTYKCRGSGVNTALDVFVGNWKLTCTEAGPLSIQGYSGSIECPDPVSFCNTVGLNYCPRNCMGRGNCVNNQCQCYKGFKGIDCGISTNFNIN